MTFGGTFTLEDISTEEVWLALSDPAPIGTALPGCPFPVAVDEGDVRFDGLEPESPDEDLLTLPGADLETVTGWTKHE
ncbi:hypothetical protein [Salinigranum sp. GCM10025319]|uniref:hypothetical protein n=1 Tax=Salinigranum sp. GCM10025319 TaxID=3252687 RepID=UPI003621E907